MDNTTTASTADRETREALRELIKAVAMHGSMQLRPVQLEEAMQRGIKALADTSALDNIETWYVIEFEYQEEGAWYACGDKTFDTIKSARAALSANRKRLPNTNYRIARKTMVSEVVNEEN